MVWQFVHWNFSVNSCPASPASSSATAGGSLLPRDPVLEVVRGLGDDAEAHVGVRQTAVLLALAEERPGLVRAELHRVVVSPGTTSFVPASSGTQKLWITLQPGLLSAPPGSESSHAVSFT